jgi:hypothetical protein
MASQAVVLLVLKASIILSVFAIGLKATFADATFLFRRPGHLIRALVSMNVLMPVDRSRRRRTVRSPPGGEDRAGRDRGVADAAGPPEEGAQGGRHRGIHHRAAGRDGCALDRSHPAPSPPRNTRRSTRSGRPSSPGLRSIRSNLNEVHGRSITPSGSTSSSAPPGMGGVLRASLLGGSRHESHRNVL